MKFIEIKPSPQLRQFVQYFWLMELNCREEQGDFHERVLPDGSSEIIFHLGDNVSQIDSEGGFVIEPNALFIGQNTRSYQITANGDVRMFGIKLFPHAGSILLQEKASQLKNKFIDLCDVFGNSSKNLFEQIGEASDPSSQIIHAEKFLKSHFENKNSPYLAYLYFAIDQIATDKGQSDLLEITRKLGITTRYLERLFVEYVGISPKTFAQIIQLQNSVHLLTSRANTSLTDISYAGGYYDQSHFIRSVKQFTGLTPSQLRKEKMLMQQPFFDSIQI